MGSILIFLRYRFRFCSSITRAPRLKLLEATGALVLAVKTDVSKAEDVEELAQKTIDRFGEVHLLLRAHLYDFTVLFLSLEAMFLLCCVTFSLLEY
jgi:NAD(P)-dependent dehydrogenase (short-subunit alcohol dehydrogenase family)